MLSDVDNLDIHFCGVYFVEPSSKSMAPNAKLLEVALGSHVDLPVFVSQGFIVAEQVPRPEELIPEELSELLACILDILIR